MCVCVVGEWLALGGECGGRHHDGLLLVVLEPSLLQVHHLLLQPRSRLSLPIHAASPSTPHPLSFNLPIHARAIAASQSRNIRKTVPSIAAHPHELLLCGRWRQGSTRTAAAPVRDGFPTSGFHTRARRRRLSCRRTSGAPCVPRRAWNCARRKSISCCVKPAQVRETLAQLFAGARSCRDSCPGSVPKGALEKRCKKLRS